MKISKILAVVLFAISLFAFSACEEEQIIKKTDGESQNEGPVTD